MCLYPVKRLVLIFFFASLTWACGKKKKQEPVENPSPETPLPTVNAVFKCEALPPGPAPFAWKDSITDANKNINTFMFNPANPDEVIFVVDGDITGYNKMYSYHVPTQKITYLAPISSFPPQINKYGWIIYSTIQNDIYKIKSNGDSVTQLTSGYNSKDPKWDYEQKNFYYFQSAYNNIPSKLLKIDPVGNVLKSKTTELPYTAVFRKSDKVIYLKVVENIITLVLRDMLLETDLNLISGPYNPKSETVHFDNLTLDNTDENFYWSNSGGIFKCEIATKKIDTLFKSCENLKFDNPVIQFVKPNEVLFTVHTIKAINNYQLLHASKAIVYNLVTKEVSELKIFP